MKPIVKGYMALSPEMDSSGIVAAVDELARTAVSGRPGPVCICIPLDVQATPCDAAALAEPFSGIDSHSGFVLDAIDSAMQAVLMAQRPLVLLGAGVRIAGMAMDVDALLARYHLPWCVSIGAVDLQDDSHPLSCGCVGPTSQRAANTLLRAADCVLALATSFDQSVTGFNISGLVANKRVFVVNVDPSERLRFHDPQITALDVSLADFLTRVGNRDFTTANHDAWRSEIRCVKAALTNDLEASLRTAVTENYLSAYDITLEISRHLPATATIVLGISLDAHSVFNAFRVTRGQRIIVSRNLGPMGWDLPALLGAYASTEDNRPLILITGDGSLMLNVQELAVIAGMQIPACMFVFCNDGYASIRTTQSNFFTKDFFGCNQESGLYLPALKSLALGFNIEHEVLHSVEAIAPLLRRHSAMGRPRLIECRIDPSQVREPRLVTRVDNGVFATPTLADMHPPLPADIAAYVKSVLRLKDD
jgi:acetolactate synthase-1/2/3 large subunit